MKEKIFQNLKQTFSNLGLGDEILQGLAETLDATGLVTDENMATVIQGQKNFLTSLQSGIDQRVTGAVNKAKEKKEEPSREGTGGAQQPDIEKMINEAIAARVNPLQEKLNAYEANEAKSARSNLIAKKAKELGIPGWREKEGFAITDEMDETAITAYLSNVKQNIVIAGLEGKHSFPLDSNKEASKEEVDAVMNKLPI